LGQLEKPEDNVPILLRGIEGIQAYAGFNLGKSGWVEISQEMINAFASTTDDWDWLCVDEERAKRGPFGRTVAQSYLIVGMVVPMLQDVYLLEGIGHGLHHGIDRLRFPTPVPVDSCIRLDVTLKSAEADGEGLNLVLDCTMECDATQGPVLQADILYRVSQSSCDPVCPAVAG
jgi:acyl dehydratase